MVENFFESLDVKEKQYIGQKFATLVDMTSDWPLQYPCLRRRRIPSVALFVAVTVPHFSLTNALMAVKMAFWLFALDDIADEQIVTIPELEKRVNRWHRIARGEIANGVQDDASRMLLEIRKVLAEFPMFDSLKDHWAHEVWRFAHSMVCEYQDAVNYTEENSRVLPSLDSYLKWGAYSVGLPVWVAAAWVVVGSPLILECLDTINKAVVFAGSAVRLYNDLKTFERERQEGTVNSVLITCRSLSNGSLKAREENTLLEAKQQVLQLADSYGQKCCEIVDHLPAVLHQVAEILRRLVAFHSYFYGRSRQEYNMTSVRDVYELLLT